MLLAKLHKRAVQGRAQWLSNLIRTPDNDRGQRSLDCTYLETPTVSPCSSSWRPRRGQQPCMRIVCMSDTHGYCLPHLPAGDVLVHAGDFTKYGETDAVQSLSSHFAQYKQRQGFNDVICIAGNHDITFHQDYYEKTWTRHIRSFDPTATREALQNCSYLQDSSTTITTNNNTKIVAYGSPWTPSFFNWAFNLKRGEALQQVWAGIPESTDILITHGPPKGRGDMTLHSGQFGCQNLLCEVQQRVKPRLHVYGHIHEGYGTSFDGQTLYVNASSLDIGYQAINPCIVIDLPLDVSKPAMVVQPTRWIRDMDHFGMWLEQNGYSLVAKSIQETNEKVRSEASKRTGEVFPDFYSNETFYALCNHLGWKRRKHALAKQELRTALCQLYAEAFAL